MEIRSRERERSSIFQSDQAFYSHCVKRRHPFQKKNFGYAFNAVLTNFLKSFAIFIPVTDIFKDINSLVKKGH